MELLTPEDHGRDEEEIDLPHGASFDGGIDRVLLLSDHGDGFIFGLGWHLRRAGLAVLDHDELTASVGREMIQSRYLQLMLNEELKSLAPTR